MVSLAPRAEGEGDQVGGSLVRGISTFSPNLILRRLEGWPRATAVQAAILRDARLRCAARLLRMRSESLDTIGLMPSIH
jgi:hypothetical protein